MNKLSPATLLEALHWRYATKKFDAAAKIGPELWEALESALVLSPSSFGLQPWKFIVVTNPLTKAGLVAHSWGQSQPADCSHLVVFALKIGLNEAHVDHFLERQVEVRGGSLESLGGYRNLMVGGLQKAGDAGHLDTWQTHQVYIALGQFMTAAALLGVDTCPMEGIVPAEYDKALDLVGSGYRTVVACAAGYRSAEDKYASLKKVRFPASEVVKHV
ncbi:MAG: NAD(P)H-dependent oxidoreductase [Verrucomicrobia bacterium]|nr:NAD(P)H-dependent oxidoreductase [Verrucomicrobiota bacterium]